MTRSNTGAQLLTCFLRSVNRATPFIVLVALEAMTLDGCSSSTTPSGVEGGSLYGNVLLEDENGRSLDNYSGATIALEPTSLKATTDPAGHFSFNAVPAGTYDVAISKAGFGLSRSYGVSVAGPGEAFLYPVVLSAIPAETPILDSATVGGWALRYDTLTFDSSTVYRYDTLADLKGNIAVFSQFSGGSRQEFYLDLTADHAPGDVHLLRAANSEFSYQTGNYGLFPLAALQRLGVRPGTKLYATSANFSLAGHYYDPVHDQNRPIGPGPRSNVITVVMP